MIERLKPRWKVLTASVGIVGLGLAAAPAALADDERWAPKPGVEAAGSDDGSRFVPVADGNGSDERIRIVGASEEGSDGTDWYVGFPETPASDGGDGERIFGPLCKRTNSC